MAKKKNESIEMKKDNSIEIPEGIDIDLTFGYHQALGEFNFISQHMNNINEMIIYNNQRMVRLEAARNKNRGDINIQFKIKEVNKMNEQHQSALGLLIPIYAEVTNDVWDGVIQKYKLDPEMYGQFKAKKIEPKDPADSVDNNVPAKMKVAKKD